MAIQQQVSESFRAGIWRAKGGASGFDVWTYAITETGHHNCLHKLASGVTKPAALMIMREHNRGAK